MLFSSPTFLFYFFPLFFLLYYISGRSNLAILLLSLLFYAWGGLNHLPLLIFYIVVNYVGGLAVSAAPRRRWILAFGIAINLSLLLTYKYLGFIENQIDLVLAGLGRPAIPHSNLLLPLGISFFTFQGISYLIDVSRGEVQPQRSLLKFAAYKTMFPQLIAGPIVRYSQVASRITRRRVSLFRLRHGIMLFSVGLAQKCLIANTAAYPADAIFGLPDAQLTAATAWLGVVCYTIQIFFDFSGYSNMAIGMGHMMGFTFPPNFNRPYTARSMTDFWRRWHMSLTSWFRDYLYLPLGGNRRGAWRTYWNLFSVFILCGLWHGASWTFAAWGLYHGSLLVIERLGLSQLLSKIWPPIRHIYVLLAVCAGWVIFRAENFPQVGHFFEAMYGWGNGEPTLAPFARYFTPNVVAALAVAVVACSVPPLSERRMQFLARQSLTFYPTARRAADSVVALCFGACSLLLAAAAALSLATNTYNPFIYFRF